MSKAGPHDDLPQYGPSKASIGGPITREERRHVAGAAREIFGKRRSLKQLASIVGAPDDARVFFGAAKGGSIISYRVEHPSLERAWGTLQRIDGKVIHEIGRFDVAEEQQRKGMAIRAQGRMVEQGARLGVRRLDLQGSRTDKEVGYIVWPIMGYDGPLPAPITQRLPSRLKSAETLQKLLKSDEGMDWWHAKGETIALSFDLAPGSPQRRFWIDYWRTVPDWKKRAMEEQMPRKQDRLDFPYPNNLGWTPEEIADGLDWLVAYNKAKGARESETQSGSQSHVPPPRQTPNRQ